MAKRGVDGVYDTDPNVDPNARRYDELTYRRAIDSNIRIMDASAFVLADEHDVTMHVFDVSATGTMRSICDGEDIGTLVHR